MTQLKALRELADKVEARADKFKYTTKDAAKQSGKEAHHRMVISASRMSEADEILAIIRAKIAVLETQ